jgi:ATP-binding cassette subfamily B protein
VSTDSDATDLPRLASRGPVLFLWHYVRRRLARHLVVLLAVLTAVSCAVGAQYAVKNLVDVLVAGDPSDWELWGAVAILLGLVAGDNLLWRLAGWIATSAFVAVGGDLRLDLFEHLSGHGTRYFADRFPGALAGRITTVATAASTIENSLTWSTIPPATAVIISIAMLGSIDWRITLVLAIIVVALGALIARLASRGQ